MSERLKTPICIMQVAGTNCDRETKVALEMVKLVEGVGARGEIVHLNEFRGREKLLADYQGLVLAGGFADGDYGGGAGRIFAINLVCYLRDQMIEFREKGKPILGICNGFQVLARTGLVPFNEFGKIRVALDQNDSGHFECRGVHLKKEEGNKCVFTKEVDSLVYYQAAHGEGKFVADPETLAKIEEMELVVFRYTSPSGRPTQAYPYNPNGALNAIAGICDITGQVLGMMPHPERFIRTTQHLNWLRAELGMEPYEINPQGLPLFKGFVNFASQI